MAGSIRRGLMIVKDGVLSSNVHNTSLQHPRDILGCLCPNGLGLDSLYKNGNSPGSGNHNLNAHLTNATDNEY